MEKKINIAIDGHSACGKSTTAKALAKHLDYIYIDTGAMYRALTYYLVSNNVDWNDEEKLDEELKKINIHFEILNGINTTFLNGTNVEHEIRGMEVSNRVSEVSRISKVRRKLVEQQQEMAASKGVVMDGRDIGTVVIPNAELKFFMTANLDKRVERRLEELQAKGIQGTFEEIKENVQGRDLIDSTREDSPLTQAENSIVIDTTDLHLDYQIAWVIREAEKIISSL